MSNVIKLDIHDDDRAAEAELREHETYLKRFIKSHAKATPQEMVGAINMSVSFAESSAADAEKSTGVAKKNAADAANHLLNAGRLLLELRACVEAQGHDWWAWQQGKFSRGRKNMEKLMRLAGDVDPEAAFEEERVERNTRMKKLRSTDLERTVRSKQSADIKRILILIAALSDQKRTQLRTQLKEIYRW